MMYASPQYRIRKPHEPSKSHFYRPITLRMLRESGNPKANLVWIHSFLLPCGLLARVRSRDGRAGRVMCRRPLSGPSPSTMMVHPIDSMVGMAVVVMVGRVVCSIWAEVMVAGCLYSAGRHSSDSCEVDGSTKKKKKIELLRQPLLLPPRTQDN